MRKMRIQWLSEHGLGAIAPTRRSPIQYGRPSYIGAYVRTKSKGKRRSPWITSEIVTLSRKKRRAYRKAVAKKGNAELWNKYKQLRKEMNQLTNNAYNDYIFRH